MEERIIQDLQWLVREKSVYREEPLQLKLARKLQGLGFQVQLQYVAPGRPNLIATRGHRPSLLLLTHADTFPAHDHDNPWELTVDNQGVVRGRGVVDAKGQIAAALEAFRYSKEAVAFSTVVDEEVDGLGSLHLQVPEGIQAAIVLEPTSLRPAIAQAGFVEIEVAITGRASHGSVPNDDDNAIVRAMRFYQALLGLPFTRILHPLLGHPKMNLEMLEGGGQRVVVPNQCRLRIDVQVPPGLTSLEVERQLCAAARAFQAELKIVDRAEPFETSPSNVVYQLLDRAIRETVNRPVLPIGMASWTDAANLVAKGVTSIVFGAGDLSVAHSSQETVPLEELEMLAKVLARLLRLWNLQAP